MIFSGFPKNKHMKKFLHYLLLPGACLLLAFSLDAQRGLPAPENTSAKVATKYPQHLDLLPEMVNLLQVHSCLTERRFFRQ